MSNYQKLEFYLLKLANYGFQKYAPEAPAIDDSLLQTQVPVPIDDIVDQKTKILDYFKKNPSFVDWFKKDIAPLLDTYASNPDILFAEKPFRVFFRDLNIDPDDLSENFYQDLRNSWKAFKKTNLGFKIKDFYNENAEFKNDLNKYIEAIKNDVNRWIKSRWGDYYAEQLDTRASELIPAIVEFYEKEAIQSSPTNVDVLETKIIEEINEDDTLKDFLKEHLETLKQGPGRLEETTEILELAEDLDTPVPIIMEQLPDAFQRYLDRSQEETKELEQKDLLTQDTSLPEEAKKPEVDNTVTLEEDAAEDEAAEEAKLPLPGPPGIGEGEEGGKYKRPPLSEITYTDFDQIFKKFLQLRITNPFVDLQDSKFNNALEDLAALFDKYYLYQRKHKQKPKKILSELSAYLNKKIEKEWGSQGKQLGQELKKIINQKSHFLRKFKEKGLAHLRLAFLLSSLKDSLNKEANNYNAKLSRILIRYLEKQLVENSF